MDLLSALRTNQLERFKTEFTWRTKDGVVKRIPDMDTTHLFNTAKLLLNKFSAAEKATLFTRGPTGYNCSKKNGQTAFFMVWEIEQRDDLERRHRPRYQAMLAEVFDPQFIFTELPQAIRPRPTQGTLPLEPGVGKTGSLASRLQEFGRMFRPSLPERPLVSVDYSELESRVMGRFASSEPQRQSIERDTVDALAYASRQGMISTEEANRRLRDMANPPQHMNSRSSVQPTRSTADLEEERLGTRVFTPEHMFETIQRGSVRDNMNLTFWMMTIPEHFREGVEWVVHDRIMRRMHRTRNDRETIHRFIAEFQGHKQSAIAANDLTRAGWVTPRAYRSEAERERQRREDERRGRGRRMGIDYLRMMLDTMGPAQFETQLMPLLQRNPGNRSLIEEFNESLRRSRMSTITAGRSENRGRNPILMVDTERGGLNGRSFDFAIIDEVMADPQPKKKAKEEKIDPAKQIEQLTTVGKRKINLGDDNG